MMSLDDFVKTGEDSLHLSRIDLLARHSSALTGVSRLRVDDQAFNYINTYTSGVKRQSYVAEYYRLRTKYELERNK